MSEKFGKYSLERKLAVGGMAEIFLATHSGPEGFKKHLAIKRILPYLNEDSDFVTMFLDEARLVARFNHPNIVQIFELGKAEGSYFLAMEFVNGVSISKLMKACRKKSISFPLEYAVKVVSYACEGLDYAHGFTDPNGEPLNLIHRDVSPQNLMLSYDGVVKVLDFGIAKAASNSYQTRTSSLKGKAAYMSPEQIIQKGGLDRRSDVFSLGIVLYELITGHRPFRGDTELELMMSIVKKPAPDPRTFNEAIPVDIVKILSRALEKNRSKRYQSCFQMRQDLEEFMLNRRIMVDNHTLGSFAREVLPPGDVGVGSSSLTPSAPSFIEAARKETGSIIPPRTTRPPKDAQNDPSDLPTLHTPSSQLRPVMESPSIPIVVETQSSKEFFNGPKHRKKTKSIAIIVVLLLISVAGLAYLASNNMGADGQKEIKPATKPALKPVTKASPANERDHQTSAKDETKTDAGKKEEQQVPKQQDQDKTTQALGKSGKAPKEQADKAGRKLPRKRKKRNRKKRPDRQEEAMLAKNPPRTVKLSPGSLHVDSRPWTSISIDGISYGATPIGPIELKPGIHKLKMENKAKGIVLTKNINILPGQAQKVREKFGKGRLLPFVKPFGEVFVDGVSRGITPLDKPIALYEGRHSVRVVCKKTGKSKTEVITIKAGDAKKLIFDLR